MATQRLEIVGGPSKFDLMLGLFSGTSTSPHYISFVIKDGHDNRIVIKFLLNGVSKEDGSGGSWLFTAYTAEEIFSANGYFSTKTRRGWIKFSSF